jgi:hemolysin activation/secretion protein
MSLPVDCRAAKMPVRPWLLSALLACCAVQAPAQSAPPVAPAAAPAAAEPAFDIWEYEIEGNSVLPVAAIERAVQAHLGPGQSMRAVEAARNALEAAYQQAGYLTVVVDIPEQRVDGGVVRLSVLEGVLGQLYVTGSRYHDQGVIRRALPGLQPGAVPNFNEVQQQLAGLNRDDSRRVQPVIKPGKLPGTVDLDLQVSDKLPLYGTLELNNQHAAGTEPLRASATLRYDNLFQREHSLALTLQTAPQQPAQSRAVVLNYSLPAGDGDTWALSSSWSNSDVETLGGTQALGRGTTVGLRHHHNLGVGTGSGTVSLGADVKFLRDRVASGSSGLETPLRYLPLQAAFNGQWSQGAESLALTTSLSLAWQRLLQRQVDCAGTPQDQFDCKTQGASGSFGVFKLDGRWTLPLGTSALVTRLAAQVASGPLVSAEQFALGGADTVRGYFESEVSADHALLGSLEWRGANLLPRDAGAGPLDLKPLAFLDLARGYLAQPGTGQQAHSSLLGAGLGLRLSATWLDAALEVAWPAKTTVNTEAGRVHVHAKVQARY